MSVTATQRDRLTQARERTRKARDEARRAREGRDLARRADDQQALVTTEVRLAQAQDEVEMASELERALLSQIAGVSGVGVGGESFLDDPNVVRSLEQLATSSMPIGNLALGPAMSRDELVAMMQSGSWRGGTFAAAGDVTIPDSARLGTYYGVVPQLRRRLRLTDLIPTQPMEGQAFTYTQEQGSFDTAFETPEAAIKPTGDLQLVDATVEAKTIAHWVKIPRQQLADVPALATVTQSRLTYGVMRRLENQIVAGDGQGENLLGILNTSGVGSIAFAAGEPLSDLTLDAISAVLVSDAEPNGVVANPLDVAAMLKAKASGSGERLDSDGAFATPPTEMWGLPLVQSKVIPVGQALVGDWSTCTVFVREAVNLRISDADQDDFVRNRVTYLGEGRFGLGIFQPTAFCLVHLK
jgi:HK97 family phage major capsid protein